MTATTWEPSTLVECTSITPWLKLPTWAEAGGCDDLTLGKIYTLVAIEAKGCLLRIIDDSGDDYLYPASHFRVM